MAALTPLLLTLCGAPAPGLYAAEPDRPNVVLILSDDQHWRDYGFMGHDALRTPNLDRLARESLVFTRGYVPSSLCCPSLAAVISGRYPHENLIVGNDPPEDPARPRKSPAGRELFEQGREAMNRRLERWPLLPQLLGAAGYRSLQTGKWWQGHYARGGFDEGMTQGSRHGDDGLAIGRKTMQPVYDFIGRCTREQQPFFVWYAPMLPHDPHDPAPELVAHYKTKTGSVPVAKYWGNVERFDRSVGELLDHLDAQGLTQNTLVVYVTDNGWITNPEHGRFAAKSKLSPYDGGLRTPIMLRQPGRIQPGQTGALASSLDIFPTILTACGVRLPVDLPGINLLDAPGLATRRQLFGECFTHTLVDLDEPARSLLWRWTLRQEADGRLWKLIVPATSAPAPGITPPAAAHSYWATKMKDEELEKRYERGEVELYDVSADPDETRNLAAAHPEVVESLRADLDAWWMPALRSAAAERRLRVLPVKAPGHGIATAETWPCWRGPTRDGVAAGTGYVSSWSPTKNVLWRVALPGLGASTPAVWGERIVLTCGVEGHDAALCFGRDGRELWRQRLGPERAGKHKKATGCNSSPVTDGEHVWVYFKSGELACLRLDDGVVVWKTNLQERFGEDTLWWDLGTSPVLTERAVVVAVMQTGPSYLAAFARESGDLLWKIERNLPAPEEAAQSYSTPAVVAGNPALGEPAEMLVVLGADHVTAHYAADGRELWRVGGLNPAGDRFFRSIASPVMAGDLVIAPYARGRTITAVRRGGRGDVTATHVAWLRDDLGADVPTPAVQDGLVVVCTDKGKVACLEAASGETVATIDLPKNRNAYSASPVVVDGRVIVVREDGEARVLGLPGRQQGIDPLAELGSGSLEEMTVATPVCIGGRILLRTHDALWCIGAAG